MKDSKRITIRLSKGNENLLNALLARSKTELRSVNFIIEQLLVKEFGGCGKVTESKPINEVVNVKKVVESVTKSNELVNKPKAVEMVKPMIVLNASCGCEYVGTLFVRSKGCKLPKEQHLPR